MILRASKEPIVLFFHNAVRDSISRACMAITVASDFMDIYMADYSA